MKKEKNRQLNRIRGSFVGGAVGDALGYTVEFMREKQIFSEYGPKGITDYELVKGKAIISDDTQMTLFTADGILVGDPERKMQGSEGNPRIHVEEAYRDWYLTQDKSYKKGKKMDLEGHSKLLEVPELFAWRAPGNTCLSALEYKQDVPDYDYIKNHINNSKGCGGIMRVAPVALAYRPGQNTEVSLETIDMEAAQIAAITHGHSLGYMPAAVVSHIISLILSEQVNMTLKEMVLDARDTAAKLFAGDSHLEELIDIMNLAVELSENSDKDLDNIHKLGEGWVAEETLGIALYCALKYQNDFSAAMIASVNHKGDSDSTGAVTGNIVGALVGLDAIDEKWKKDLELYDLILETADALY